MPEHVYRVRLGRDPIPQVCRDRIALAVAELEVKLYMIETGQLSAQELDLYEWDAAWERPPSPSALRCINVTIRRRAVPRVRPAAT